MSGPLTADTITDEQIHLLHSRKLIGNARHHFALRAIGPDTRRYYRGECAEIFNANASTLAPE